VVYVETDVEVLDIVAMLDENRGQPLVDVAESEVNVSFDVEIVVKVEDDDSCVVEGLAADVSKENGIVVDSETVSKVGVDLAWPSMGEADTGELSPLPMATPKPPGSCPEVAGASS
jgi:hypothetical protein